MTEEANLNSKSTTSAPRLDYLDSIKSLMIIFVVIMHAAVTYSGMGRWYYTEQKPLGVASWYIFSFYQTFTQAYFMSLLFMVSGYFVPSSLQKKGAKKFIYDRIIRLGIPTLLYMLFINPICVLMTHSDVDFLNQYIHGIITFKFLGWSGPLWFALALLIFAVTYVVLKKWCDALLQLPFPITGKSIPALILLITTFAFTLRIFFPRDTAVLNPNSADHHVI